MPIVDRALFMIHTLTSQIRPKHGMIGNPDNQANTTVFLRVGMRAGPGVYLPYVHGRGDLLARLFSLSPVQSSKVILPSSTVSSAVKTQLHRGRDHSSSHKFLWPHQRRQLQTTLENPVLSHTPFTGSSFIANMPCDVFSEHAARPQLDSQSCATDVDVGSLRASLYQHGVIEFKDEFGRSCRPRASSARV